MTRGERIIIGMDAGGRICDVTGVTTARHLRMQMRSVGEFLRARR